MEEYRSRSFVRKKPDLRKQTLDALSEVEKTEYNTVLFAFDVCKKTTPHVQLKICAKITGANQEPTEDEINEAMGRLKAI